MSYIFNFVAGLTWNSEIMTYLKYRYIDHDWKYFSGYHTLYEWYRSMESKHFPDPNGVRARIEQWTFGLYPACIKYLMSAFDVPEVITVLIFINVFFFPMCFITFSLKDLFLSKKGYGGYKKYYLQEGDGVSFSRCSHHLLRISVPLFLGPIYSCCLTGIWKLSLHLHQLVQHSLRWSLLLPSNCELQGIHPIPHH